MSRDASANADTRCGDQFTVGGNGSGRKAR
jgi:hypothetical protein